MADNRFPASIGDYSFDCQTLYDSFEQALAISEIPYRDGGLVENMGQKARRIGIRCFFLNDNYEAHKGLINYLTYEADKTAELTHPAYGVITGQVETISVRHDDRNRTAEVDLSFVEAGRGTMEISVSPSPESATEEAFIEGQEDLTEEFESDLTEEFGAESGVLTETEVVITDDILSLLAQFSGLSLSKKARDYVKTADAFVAALRSTLAEVSVPASSLVSSITYDNTLPGVVLGELAAAIERYATLYDGLTVSPSRFLDSFDSGISEGIEDVVSELSSSASSSVVRSAGSVAAAACFAKYVTIAKAQRAAVEAGAMFREDQVAAAARKTTSNTFNTMGRLQRPIEPLDEVLTVRDVETALDTVRTMIQAAVDGSRGTAQSLKDAAEVLTDYVVEIKKLTPSLVAVEVDNETPLHLVCVQHGLSYQEAETLLLLNDIRSPSFVRGTVNLYG